MGGGVRVLGSSTMHMTSPWTAEFSTRLLPAEVQAAGIGPARSEHAVRRGDGVDVHVLRTVVAGELLEHLGVAQDDVAVGVDDPGAASLSTATHRPFPISAPCPQFDEPFAATRRPKTLPDASGDSWGCVIGG